MLGITDDTNVAAALMRTERSFPVGYPFAVSTDDVPPQDAHLHGMLVIGGLFATVDDARAYQVGLPGSTVVALATEPEQQARGYVGRGSYEDWAKGQEHVVYVAQPAPAYAPEQIEQLEARLNELPWEPLPRAHARRQAALQALTPLCRVDAGAVFVATGDRLYRFGRTYAPVKCGDREAWISWRATRLETTFGDRGTEVNQVILVECDSPTVESRAMGPAPTGLGKLIEERCD